ncbi:MAG: hypothetical protein EZS28_006247 [Streblomastix strix]|uniref:Tyr recombinase domain-containing protein n=1 Tax=Streblomastix strix TaxID=222440 RepID=A0A5J4WTV0_9EUKA|nr:MAG: hypothetical protein EZS28_006247 [Streblomastix strix]
MENTYFRVHIACRIPQEDPLAALVPSKSRTTTDLHGKLSIRCNKRKVFRQLCQELTIRIAYAKDQNATQIDRQRKADLGFRLFINQHQIISPTTRIKPLFNIAKRAIAATLVMVSTVARLAELHRVTLLNTSDDEICPLRWFKSWFADREPNIPNKAQEFRRISKLEKYIQADDLSKAIRAAKQFVGISKTYSVTSIRAAAITKLLNYNISRVQVDRFTHQSDTASTIRQYYNKNNNVETREVLGQTKQELDNEEDEEQERTLLEEKEHERSNVEWRISSPVGDLSPGLSHLEFPQSLNSIHITQSQSSIEIKETFQPFLQYSRTPTQVVVNQKAQQDAAIAAEVARLLDPFNIGRVNKQSKSSLSLQEVVNNPEEYKHSSGREMSSSFVPPHQDVPTLGNLGQSESYEVQTMSSADEEHEALLQNEKETDDSGTTNALICSSS